MKKILILIMILLVSLFSIGGCGMNITNPQVFDHVKEVNGGTLRPKLINIGEWDMDASYSKVVPHGLTLLRILHMSVMIIKDGDDLTVPLNYPPHMADYDQQGGIESVDLTNINLWRKPAGFFDGISYDEPGKNRGYILIWYVD